MSRYSRRAFVTATAVACVAPVGRSRAAVARDDGALPDDFPAQPREDVRAVVGAAHTDLDTVRAMVEARPELARAAWDWGFGDWESTLGAASHMGRHDIAALLIEHGARPNLFTYAMLGQVEVVRAICTANPGAQRALGPHGITLLRHARAGGDAARSVVAYLEELGDADVGQTSLPIDESAARRYLGDYAPANGAGDAFRIGWHARRKGLTLARGAQTSRPLLRVGDHAFAPAGAPTARVTFEVETGAVTALVIDTGARRVRARRVAT